MLRFESIAKGIMTENWGAVDGNERKPGEVRIGGFKGGGESVADGSEGSIVVVRLRVTCKECKDGSKARISIQNLTDDLAGMNIVP
jgi:hypothetical protein